MLSDAETEALRPGSTRPWNPAAGDGYGTGFGDGTWHAVRRPFPAAAVAVCGSPVRADERDGTYDRLSAPVSVLPCLACAWSMAIKTGSTGRELALITPAGAEAASIARAGADPALPVRIILAILAVEGEDGDGLDGPLIPQLLDLATRHRPVLYCSEDAAEDGWGGPGIPEAEAGCAACTPRAGSWAGEWEDQVLPGLLVPAPCSVLAVLAARYRIPARPGFPMPAPARPGA